MPPVDCPAAMARPRGPGRQPVHTRECTASTAGEEKQNEIRVSRGEEPEENMERVSRRQQEDEEVEEEIGAEDVRK